MPDSLVAAVSFAPISHFAPAHMRQHGHRQQLSHGMAVPLPSILSRSFKRPLSPLSDDAGRRRASSTAAAMAHDTHSESDHDHNHALTQQHTTDLTESVIHAHKPPQSVPSQTQVQSEPQAPTKKRRRNNVTATIEIRELREVVQQLEATLETLVCKWQREIQDPALWSAAYETARQKRQTALVEAQHGALLEQLTAQQLHMAMLQSLLPQSPLCAMPSSLEIFRALHAPLHLRADASDAERRAQLQIRDDAALRLAPGLVDRFAASHLGDASTAVPFSRTSIAADAAFTYVSTIFIARIPRVSVARVCAAVMSYCRRESGELARRYDVVHDVEPIHVSSPSGLHEYAQVRYTSPTSFTSVSCSSFVVRMGGRGPASEDESASVGANTGSDVSTDATSAGADTDTDAETPSFNADGVVVVDFVDRDDRFPAASDPARARRETSFMISVSTDPRATDPVTGQPQVLLRQVRVDRFSLSPDAPLLRDEVRMTQQWSNGDLFMALVCEHLMANAP